MQTPVWFDNGILRENEMGAGTHKNVGEYNYVLTMFATWLENCDVDYLASLNLPELGTVRSLLGTAVSNHTVSLCCGLFQYVSYLSFTAGAA